MATLTISPRRASAPLARPRAAQKPPPLHRQGTPGLDRAAPASPGHPGRHRPTPGRRPRRALRRFSHACNGASTAQQAVPSPPRGRPQRTNTRYYRIQNSIRTHINRPKRAHCPPKAHQNRAPGTQKRALSPRPAPQKPTSSPRPALKNPLHRPGRHSKTHFIATAGTLRPHLRRPNRAKTQEAAPFPTPGQPSAAKPAPTCAKSKYSAT